MWLTGPGAWLVGKANCCYSTQIFNSPSYMFPLIGRHVFSSWVGTPNLGLGFLDDFVLNKPIGSSLSQE